MSAELKQRLIELLSDFPDDPVDTVAEEELLEEDFEPQAEKTEDDPVDNVNNSEPEPAEVQRAEIPDVELVTPEAMLSETIDSSFIEFRRELEEFKATISLLKTEVETLKGNFTIINDSIDANSRDDITENLDFATLINRL